MSAVVVAQDDPIGWPAAIVVSGLVALVLIGSGFVVIKIARRTADGRLGRNGWAGIRTHTTRSSDAAWSAAHQAAERLTVLGGLATMAGGIVPVVAGAVGGLGADGDQAPDRYMTWWAVAFMIAVPVMLVPVIWGAVVGQRAAKAVADGDAFTG